MNLNDLCVEIEKAGGEIEPIKRHCKFQTVFAKNIFEYCKQCENPDCVFNLGSAGGPAIACEGTLTHVAGWELMRDEQGNIIHKPFYKEKTKPCAYYIEDGEVIGYKIILPREGKKNNETYK